MLILAILILLYWVAMLIQEVLNLISVPRLNASWPLSHFPFVSIIVPARNEEASIETTVRALLAQDYPHFEVVVVDDRSDDQTPLILQQLLSAIPDRLVVVSGSDVPSGWLGKPWALHQGATIARGDLLLFVDADIYYAPRAVRSLVAAFLRYRAGVVSVIPRLEMVGFWENLLMPWLSFAALVTMPVWLAQRTTEPRFALGGGPGNLLERSTYEAVGGHAALRAAVIDDIGLVRLVRRLGRCSLLLQADHLVSVRMYRGFGDIFRGFTKNSAVAMGKRLWVNLALVFLGVVFHLVPFAFALMALVQLAAREPVSVTAAVGVITVGLIMGIRLILFTYLGFRIDSALLGHPIAAAIFLYILLRSAWDVAVRKKLTWRGRTYAAEWIRFGGE